MTKTKWTIRLDEAIEKSIHWYPRWSKRDNVIIKCKGFSNVPFMDTQGDINYNPSLTLRQGGYLMLLPSFEEVVTPFAIHSLGAQHGEHLRKIWRAWKNIVRKGHEWGLQSCAASSSYKSWLQGRMERAFLTFNDPRLETLGDESVGVCRLLKRGQEDNPDQQVDGGGSLKALFEVERWARVATQEKYRRELEQEQALEEKDELTSALANAELREAKVQSQLHQFQGHIASLEAKVAKSKLHNEHLEQQ
ncbi:hypothetical protein CR513_42245, partial [Mucuna pruriens]